MEQYYRLVIDTLKQALSDYASTGALDPDGASEAILRLDMETDRRIVSGEPCGELASLKEDLMWLKCDLPDYE